ncbi:E3 ubiquitin-protein ligase MBR2-like [Ricinus communis]|uniref:RING-type E3 ubiquitin transferase n=1 Tax=Ricinus communis TaxID=3988 RepID=B9S2A1_RICCO|nr:E3 ubiquitin-protein ligase MBR2-like [Ricinus communis]EEF42175.1 zinc finger protein, putative [Ricinus communis]
MHRDRHHHLTVAPMTPQDMEKHIHSAGLNASSLQVYFNLSYQVEHQSVLVHADGRQAFLGSTANQFAVVDSFFFDFGLLSSYQASFKHLSPIFARLLIDSSFHEILVFQIIQEVAQLITTGDASKTSNFMPFNINVLKHCIHIYQEEELIDHVISQSREEYEIRNFGMVPTAPKSRKLKCVKMSETETTAYEGSKEGKSQICTVCLEELEDFAAAMPCGHLFHGACIHKWLENSHYCPLCRYEMPTKT